MDVEVDGEHSAYIRLWLNKRFWLLFELIDLCYAFYIVCIGDGGYGGDKVKLINKLW